MRDRAEAYAEGNRVGAPTAQQVADRFHLVHNASAALDALLLGRRRSISWKTSTPTRLTPVTKPSSPSRQLEAERRAARISEIAREFGMDRRTGRLLLTIADPPRNAHLHPRPSGLRSPTVQPYVPYLQERWQQGCHNVSQLYP